MFNLPKEYGYYVFGIRNKDNGCYEKFYVKKAGVQELHELNFDTDPRGGLRMVFGDKVDLGLIDNMAPIFQNVGTFIPIYAWESPVLGAGYLVIGELHHFILQNKYLKHKAKYVLYDGIVERIKYFKVSQKEKNEQKHLGFFVYQAIEE